MTFGIKNVAGGLARRRGDTEKREGFFGTSKPVFGAGWKDKKICKPLIEKGPQTKDWTVADIYVYLWGAHCAHALEFVVAVFCYVLLYSDGSLIQEAKEWQMGWVSRIVLFNLCCELVIVNFWHYWSYASDFYTTWKEGGVKYNPDNQYEPDGDKNGMFTSSTGNLEREITFTTLGWLQSAGWQCLFTHLWACGSLPVYFNFWQYPVYSFLILFATGYWREIHFFFGHRGMHPWWDRQNGLFDGDVGAFLYRHVHSLHHKSYNPGPWSGLCMHPVEHLIYYSCATLPPLIICVHPLHFLYCKFHADIAPVGGHDGMDEPGGKGDFHYLHHAKFECNYGVPFPINLDLLFGTWADYETWKETGELTTNDWAKQQMHEPDAEDGGDKKKVPLLADENPVVKDAPVKKEFTMAEVAAHKSPTDAWIVLYGQVLDVTKFLDMHPGGTQILLNACGSDATTLFNSIHFSSGGYAELIPKNLPDGPIGVLANYDGPAPPEPAKAQPMKWPGAMFFFPVLAITAYCAMKS